MADIQFPVTCLDWITTGKLTWPGQSIQRTKNCVAVKKKQTNKFVTLHVVGKYDKSVGSFVRAFDIPHHVMDDTDLHPYHTTTRLHLKPFCCFGMYTYLQHNVRAVDVNRGGIAMHCAMETCSSSL